MFLKSRRNQVAFFKAAYKEHFEPVVKYAKRLAKEVGADEGVVEIASWLHDIGSIHGHKDTHHEYGRDYAQKYLSGLGYPQDKIDMVKHAIYAHRGSQSIARETKEAECVADADAMSHIYDVVSLFRLAFKDKQLETEDAREFVKSKLERSYNKLSDFGKQFVKDQYDAVMMVLSNNN
ncbi:HD domain-containing protein [Patescibacteria group bacterium]|nr:HD domain-containing protein [Patescibacteria group bacterium]MBU4452722.1 HD domain-containing protein [Patescibacteria group bacterium]MCG2687656.1 HD domain-containing protein [Candidatus Parcubacteria bacterium]